jgi:hypothetical protein
MIRFTNHADSVAVAARIAAATFRQGVKITPMAIDNPIDAFEQQYMNEEPQLSRKLAKFMGDVGSKLAFPDGGLALDILMKVADALFDRDSAAQRVLAMWEMVKGEFTNVEKTKASHEDVQRAIQLAIWYDRHERNDQKRERYVKLIGNALRSEQQIDDVTSFIQTIEQLDERDVTVLKVLNKIMNKQGDWRPQANPGGDVMKVHPNTFIQRSQELSVQIALALSQTTEKNLYSREVGYGICNRLQGFGLAHEIQVQSRELPLTNYCFRLSTQGIKLLKLLGEEVPNLEHYFSD